MKGDTGPFHNLINHNGLLGYFQFMYILVNKFSDTFLGKNLEVKLLDLRSFSLLTNISNFTFYADKVEEGSHLYSLLATVNILFMHLNIYS